MVPSLLRWFCPDHLIEEIEGDLLHKYQRDVKTFGETVARRKLLWNTIRFFRPGIILRNRLTHNPFNMNLIRNYLIIAFRSFNRQKSYTLLNLVGLCLGVTASLVIIQYVKYERSFDRFHSRADDIYRIQYNGWKNGELNFESAVAVPAAAAALASNFPEVVGYTRFLPAGDVMSYQKPGEEPRSFREERVFYADTSLFEVFDFRLLKGYPETCLKGTNKVIMSQATARKYFGDDEPIGKRITDHGNGRDLEVTGVFANVPDNSHIKFDLLISYETIDAMTKNESETSWGWYDFYSFVLLRPGTDPVALQAKWDKWLATTRAKEWGNNKQEFILRPLTDIHLYSNLLYETSPEDLRDGDSVSALNIISIFILIIAWVNYINLATARSIKRANEVGVRKVVGAERRQLVSQFMTESFLLNLISVSVAVLMVRLLWPPFATLTGWNIPLDFFFRKDFWILVISLFFVGTVLSGFYPAIVLSSFKPAAVLKGKIAKSSTGSSLRKGLVIIQFAASVFLISGALIVYQQLDYMKNKDLGVDITETLVLKGPGAIDSLYEQKYDAFKTELLRIPGVKGMSATSNIPGKENYWTRNISRLTDDAKSALIVTHAAIDHDFIPQFGVKVLAGRNFDKNFPEDDNGRILINESLSKALHYRQPQDAIGQVVVSGRDTLEVAGVVADFHQLSLKAQVIPIAYRLFNVSSFYSIKLETTNYRDVIAQIEEPWQTFFPGNPIDYFFLDQFYNRQYDRDDRFSHVFTLFTALAIFIASLGLIGLASFMAVQRTKEIGIRKVLGATASGIVGLLSKDFLKPIFIAIIIAIPLGWWLMEQWLQSFAYRIGISPWVFIISGILVLLIAFISVSSQTLRAALTKPAETLKYE